MIRQICGQDGTADADNNNGALRNEHFRCPNNCTPVRLTYMAFCFAQHWVLANEEMRVALEYAGCASTT